MSSTQVENLLEKIKSNFNKTDEVINVIKSGSNTLSHDVTVERLVLDESWINAIDTALVSIESIVRAPKRSIKEDHLIVAVEKANKVNQKSVQHLSTHSENIKFANDGEIMPSKVLTSIVEENLAIYENRFLITLLNKVGRFVDDRYKIIKKIIDVKTFDKLSVDSSFKLGRSKVNCNIVFDIEDIPVDDVNMKNAQLISKVDNIKRRLSLIKKSEFYIVLRNAKPVFAPIVKTNILTKNVDYNNAYKLWVFMAGYTEEGFTLEVEHKNLPCDDDYSEDILSVISFLASTGVVNHNIRREAFNNLEYRKVIDKKFKIVTKFNYKPNFSRKSLKVSDEVINEYYFRKMRSELGKSMNESGNVIVQEKDIKMPFAKFYRAVTKVSNELYKDVLDVPYKQIRKANPTKFDKINAEYARQKEVCHRANVLSGLKAQELNNTLNAEVREFIKLEKLKFELEHQGEKKLDREINEAIRRATSRRINAKAGTVNKNSELYREELLEQELDRQAVVNEQRTKAITKKEERERRLLAKLKQKYESGDNDKV